MNLRLRLFLLSLMMMGGAGIASAQTANFTFSPTSGCAPAIITFTSTSTGTITGYSWNFGNSITSTLQNPSVTYTAPGTYTITLTVTGPGGSNTKTASIVIYGPPTINFSYTPTAGCAPLGVQFTSTVTPNSPGNLTYNWNFGDGTGSSSANPLHTYTVANTYSVTLTVTNGQGCSNTLVLNNIITVHPKPVTTVTGNTLWCSIPALVPFNATSTSGMGPYTYTWDFGDGSSGSGASPTHTYAVAGTYTVVIVTQDARGCTDSLIKTNYITTRPNVAGFTMPTDGCDSSAISFADTTTGSSYTRWNFGDGDTTSGTSVGHTYLHPGSYSVRMVNNVNGCSDTIYHTINIHPKPVVTISHNIPCPAPISMQFTATSSLAGNYQWSWASGGTATGASVAHYYAHGMCDTARVVVTTPFGCSDTAVMDTVYVRDIVIKPQAIPHDGCVPYSTVFSIYGSKAYTHFPCGICTSMPFLCPYPYSFSSVSWTIIGTGGVVHTTTNDTAHATLSNTGGLMGAVEVHLANGCIYRDTTYAIGGNKVPPSFYSLEDSVCVKEPVHFINTTNDSGIAYHWDYGENDTNNGDYHGYHRYLVPGTYTIKLISDWSGCYDTLVRPLYVFVKPSNAMFRDSIYCPPSTTVQFIDTSRGALTHYWTFGDGGTSTTASPLHTYALPGTYPAIHYTTNSVWGCADTVIDTVHVVPVNLLFSATDTALCLGDTVHFLGSYSGPALDSFAWGYNGVWADDTDGHGLTYRSFYSDSVFHTPGYYSVGLRITNYGTRCTTTVTKNNYVIVSHPVANFGASPRMGCTPLLVTFADSSSYTPGTQPINRTWAFGGGGTLSNNNPTSTYTYNTASIYNVKLKVTDWNGCPDSITKSGYIEARHPSAYFLVNKQAACKGEPLIFTNVSVGATGLHYYWTFGDGDTSTATSPTHAYTNTGTYTVRLVATDSTGCSDTMNNINFINITKPTASFTQSDTLAICIPLIVTFNAAASTGYNSLSWNFGNTGTSTLISPVTTYTAPGIYNIQLVATDPANCTDTARGRMRVLGYAGALTYTPLAGCSPLEVTFTSAITNVPTLVWDFADGDTALGVGATIKHTYTTPGAYLPRIVFSNGPGCSASSLGLDTIKVDAVIPGFKAMPPCERTTIQLVDTSYSYFSAKSSWFWRFDNGQIASGPSVPHLYPTAGSYPVTLIVTNARGCKDSLTRNVTIYPLPVITASPDTAVCPPDAVTISATGGVSYVWSPGGSLSCTGCDAPAAGPAVPTAYVVVGTDEHGCQNRDTVKIGIQTKTTFTTRASGEICLGGYFTLSAAGATVYSWSPSQTLDSPLSSHPVATPVATTTYIVTGKEGSCLADTHSVKVIVNPLPTAYAGEDLKVVAGKTVILQASGQGIHHLLWSPDSTLSCSTCFAPEAQPKVATTYTLKTYTDKGCEATDSVRVVVLCDGSQLFIPNTFTPNGDGQNDYFYPRGQGLAVVNSMRVYSRWGEKVFEVADLALNDERRGWNGNFNGRQMNPDTYVYIIEATCDTGSPIMWKGDVTLVR